MVPLEVFIDIILSVPLWPWGDSVSNRNQYQEYFLGGKGGRRVGLTTLPPSYADCLKSGSLNLLPRPVMGLFYLFYLYQSVLKKQKNIEYLG
jgi:hypothetical protein